MDETDLQIPCPSGGVHPKKVQAAALRGCMLRALAFRCARRSASPMCRAYDRNQKQEVSQNMIYILAGITGIVILICAADGIVNLWDWLEKSRKG